MFLVVLLFHVVSCCFVLLHVVTCCFVVLEKKNIDSNHVLQVLKSWDSFE